VPKAMEKDGHYRSGCKPDPVPAGDDGYERLRSEPARVQYAAAVSGAGLIRRAEAARGQRQTGASAQEGYSEAMPRYRENRPRLPGAGEASGAKRAKC